jgi:hypothetical protein
MGWIQDPGSEIRKQTYAGSRGQKSIRSRAYFLLKLTFSETANPKAKFSEWQKTQFEKRDLETCRKVESGTGNSNRTVLEATTMKIMGRGADRPEKAFHDPLSVPRFVLSPAELIDYGVAGLSHTISFLTKMHSFSFYYLLLHVYLFFKLLHYMFQKRFLNSHLVF